MDMNPNLLLANDYVDYLQHYGVKGQRWGVRKRKVTNPNYSKAARQWDSQVYGNRVSNQINKRMNRKGVDHDTARNYILRRNQVIARAAKTTLTMAATTGVTYAGMRVIMGMTPAAAAKDLIMNTSIGAAGAAARAVGNIANRRINKNNEGE
ncbi:MAG: hypothetical protein HUJ78_02890 [Mogibacterium sp.]|nr:hypothetical protein [Mogibacterium sp.]MCF0239803.1 hypothetical protein [Streptococcus gallolyticus]